MRLLASASAGCEQEDRVHGKGSLPKQVEPGSSGRQRQPTILCKSLLEIIADT